ncbi:disease resistance protein RGA5-like isoform X3 [Miscanthus floridulus]
MVTVDPRLEGMYRKATELVGIDKPKKELAKRLLEQECLSPSRQQSNIISIVGFGGLGKTTLANLLLQDFKENFDCHIFVSVSLNPDIMRIFKNILLQLDYKKCLLTDEPWEMKQHIDKIIELLRDKRYLCVIDDLWKESAWDTIKLAFQDGHTGSRIIITTRSKIVAEHVGGGVYELKPLSDDDSRKLLSKRIFDTHDGCPPSLVEVTGKILKKCGGVPLAIITTASLLASKPMCSVEWEKLNKSIGFGHGNSLHVDNMRKILSLSYNDLPFHLKSCLLSLNKYIEDQVIEKDVLILSWIAEGFIIEETQPAGTSLQEVGENYFNELINRSLIQPVHRPVHRRPLDRYTEVGVDVHACRVHDMVLELINQLSSEEGFVTTLLLEDGQQASALTSAVQKRKIRRLSIHNSNKSDASPEAREQLSKVRSLDIFGRVRSIPPLSSFHVLRVLQVDDCSDLESNHLNNLGKLRHLRYLRLHCLQVSELPESIGDLESLETLDIRRAYIWQEILLPLSFGKLGKLVRLLSERVKLPDGVTLKNMKSLQELVGILVTLHAVSEIGKLRQLKVLVFGIILNNFCKSDMELIPKCLQMCPSLQVLFIVQAPTREYSLDFLRQVPSGLQKFVSDAFFQETFPRWINSSLSCLTILSITLCGMHILPEHLDKLAALPSLRFLGLSVLHANSRKQEHIVFPSRTSTFLCLTEFQFDCRMMFLKFRHGAIRKLHRLVLKFDARMTTNFDYGLENLPSLRHVVVQLRKDFPEAQDDISKAINDHPNHPSLDLSFFS